MSENSVFSALHHSKLAFLNAFTALLSCTIACAIPLFQTSNVSALYDISYMVTNWYRIAEGQIPYRDFILLPNLGHFLIGGLLFKLFGTSYFVVLIWMCFVNLVSILVLRRILKILGLSVIQCSFSSLVLSFMLPYSISALPNYDADSSFLIILCIYFLMHLVSIKSLSRFAWFSLGVAGLVPFMIKQNVGIAFLVALVLALAIGLQLKQLSFFIAGTVLTIGVLALVMSLLGILANWWNYVFIFAADSRLGDPLKDLKSLPGNPQFITLVFAVFSLIFFFKVRLISHEHQLVLSLLIVALSCMAYFSLCESLIEYFSLLPEVDTVAQAVLTSSGLYNSTIFLLFWIPWFFGAVTCLSLSKELLGRKLSREKFMYVSLNLILLCSLYSALLSQGIQGSTYSNGSLLVLLFVSSLKLAGCSRLDRVGERGFQGNFRRSLLVKVVQVNYSTFLLILAIVYGASGLSGGRLGYIDLEGQRRSTSLVAWLKTPGEYLPDQKFAAGVVSKYSTDQTVVVLIPNAELAYVIADKPPLADLNQFDTTVNPYGDDLERFLNCNLVRVVAFNTRNQVYLYQGFTWKDWPPPLSKYELVESVGPFDVFVLSEGEFLAPQEFICPSTSYSRRQTS